MEQSSEDSTASEDTGYEKLPILPEDTKFSYRCKQSDQNGLAQKKKREQKDFENTKKIERGRAKSVGRNVRKGSKVSSEKLKRTKSMDRSEGKTEKDSKDKSESSEREEGLTLFTKMTDKERSKTHSEE